MSFYDAMRHFADSWALLALTLIFAAILVWAFRPGSQLGYREQADIPFKYDPEGKDRD
ncbi:cbb3-type cytochrome c oxidase subunit 3 [Aureimonas sp. Leaf454]|uniref:cbb3-type cytochrome c oxidase subunit 3 n=1 Tax=Aureimonas sp. Leaf454 TaxID=1736381 RepID=UPI0009E8B694|nr:cbb3-type cytochrome c oxidase subunit 3 [Aureimonas sp. Leaf454]